MAEWDTNRTPLDDIREHVSNMTIQDLQNRFGYHKPTSDAIVHTHENIRSKCLDLAKALVLLVPEGREQALAITKLEEVMFWANAGVARTQKAGS